MGRVESRSFIKKIWFFLLCRIGIHRRKQHYVENITTDSNAIITVGWWDCHDCGASKINFFYGNKPWL